MAGEGAMASMLDDGMKHRGSNLRDVDFQLRKAEEAALRRHEASAWLRKVVGVAAARDLPLEPSEEEFRFGLRSGIILCNALNKVQLGAVLKVVEGPCDDIIQTDGAALSAFQYFENLRNFLVAVESIGIPTFEASDLEQGGKSARIVNCVLALKSYCDWKQSGGHGMWKFGGNIKSSTPRKLFVRKYSEPFAKSLSSTLLTNENTLDPPIAFQLETSKLSTLPSLISRLRSLLSDGNPENAFILESVLRKVAQEFEQQIASQFELKTAEDGVCSQRKQLTAVSVLDDELEDGQSVTEIKNEECSDKYHFPENELQIRASKCQTFLREQQRDIQEIKGTLLSTKAGVQLMQMNFHDEFNNMGTYIHCLFHAASDYHKVCEENRKLYNQVQDLKGRIRVYCRVRPFLPGKPNYLTVVNLIDDETITINTPPRLGKGPKMFTFNKIFGPSATQVEVFSDMQPLIRSVLDGYNICIFAYGQTGSGKTFTMTGPNELIEKNQGVNYRALNDLFLLAHQRNETFQYTVSVQMIEIYNEQVKDLLVTDGSEKKLEIRNSSHTGLSVPEANMVPVSSTSDVIYLMNLGQSNRAVCATALNDHSSRSHSCLTVHVEGKILTSGTVLRGCMHLIDLAGSERVEKSEATGDRLKEAQHINKSLSALGDVIASLAQKNSHIPYRNSKLTQLLQESLGRQAKTLMFVHISPEPDAVAETISTLKFAERVSTVDLGTARVNVGNAYVKDLKEQIVRLKMALATKEEQEQLQNYASINSERFQRRTSDLSEFTHKHRINNVSEGNILRLPAWEGTNIEVFPDAASRLNGQFSESDVQSDSSSFPPAVRPSKNYTEEKETVVSQWIDKVVVNMDDVAHQKETFFGQQLHTMTADADLDVTTSDSNETDLQWHLKSTDSELRKSNQKMPKNLVIRRTSSPMLSSSSPPVKKLPISIGTASPLHHGRKQLSSTDIKRKIGYRK